MKREPWSIGCSFGYAIRILNSIFCRGEDIEGWSEEDKEMGEDNKWLVVEQINSMCSEMMIDDASDVLVMLRAIPKDRLCERIDCRYHHPEDAERHNFAHFQDKCDECENNGKSKLDEADRIHHFESK